MIDTAALSDQELLLFIELRHMCERAKAANARVEQLFKRDQRSQTAPNEPSKGDDRSHRS